MAGDFQFEKGASFGEWLHGRLHEDIHFETEAWALDRVQRVEDRLQAGRPDNHRLLVEIPWMETVTAFTCPGRYIYFTRSLYQLCGTDAEVAMVIAHEMAHHDLDHVSLFASWASKMIHFPGAMLFAYAFLTLEQHLYGLQKECDADRHGLDLCIKAGYNAQDCLALFDVLEQYAGDIENLDMIYGPDLSDDELGEHASWKAKVEIWAWEHKHGHLPIRDRRQMLLQHLQEKQRQNATGDAI
jgi:Zn-dependent protease with chaperone function